MTTETPNPAAAPTATKATKAPTTDAPSNEAAPVPKGPTLFVGNLDFSTTSEEISLLFGQDKVQSVRLIKRFGRFKGYGFVSFHKQQDADQAVADFDGKSIKDRQIKVQPATEPKPKAPKPEKPVVEGGAADVVETSSGEKKKKSRKPKQNKRVDDAAPVSAADGEKEPVAAAAKPENAEGEKKKRKPRQRKPKAAKPESGSDEAAVAAAPKAEASAAPKAPKESKPKRQQQPREPRPPRSSELSKTCIFVGNLPFEVEDDDLSGLFADYKISKARVAKNKGRSKGFGFVYFEEEKACSEAISEFEGALLEGRQLIIKHAFAQQTLSAAAAE